MNISDGFKNRLKRALAKRHYFLIRYTDGDGHRSKWIESAERAARSIPTLLDPWEVCNILSALRAVQRVPGVMAEVGVAYGGSARLIAEYGGRHLHLFDTFSGLPAPQKRDSRKFRTGDFKSDLDLVRERLKDYPVSFHIGMFPQTASAVADQRFSFVHLDVDLYQSTLDGLDFFYSRLSPGGVILSHDYASSAGVTSAFAEFFASKPDPVFELIGYQCMATKLA